MSRRAAEAVGFFNHLVDLRRLDRFRRNSAAGRLAFI